jgi:putative hydrolase of the HAD superfamily
MTWLLCDYGEVLCLTPPAPDRAALEAAAGWVPGDERGDFWQAYWAFREGYDRADLTVQEYWRTVLGYSPSPGQLDKLVERDVAIWLHPNPPSLSAAARARDRGLQLAILSNAPIEVAEAIDAAPWLEIFDPRFFSCQLRSVKPEPAIYAGVLEALQSPPDDVVFFDDRPANVAGARAAGMTAVLFEDPGQLDAVGSG